jgi:hypothetical protein
MQRIQQADWAAVVPWSGVSGKPDIPNLKGYRAGYVFWDGSRFSTTSIQQSGGSGTTINGLDAPATAVRSRPLGKPNEAFEQVWARYECNVLQYGATRNGVDSSGAFNSAIADINNAGGGTLYIPSGEYAAKNLDTIQVPCLIRGDGIGNTSIDGLNSSIFAFYGYPVGFKDISLNWCYDGILAENCAIYVDSVSFIAAHKGINLLGVMGGHINNTYYVSTGTACVPVYGTANDLHISNANILTGTAYAYGIYLSVGSGCSIDGVFGTGITNNLVYVGTGISNSRIANVAGRNVLGAELVYNGGTNNFVDGVFGLGGNTDTRWNNRKEIVKKITWGPGSIPSGYGYYENFTMPGVVLGDQAICGHTYVVDPWLVPTVNVIANDSMRISVLNVGTSAIFIGTSSITMRVYN